MDIVKLSYGSGGADSAEFVQNVFMPYFKDIMPYSSEDCGVFALKDGHGNGNYVTSTDSYIITPIVFAGGNIGKLCVCGSSNDVAMMGGKPLYLNIGFIIEEGFDISLLKKVAESVATECKLLNVIILSADTKVLPKITTEKEKLIFINTTCIGSVEKGHISSKNLKQNDCIILSGKIGNHGSRIFLEQNNIAITSNIKSDCASLYPMLAPLLQSNIPIHSMRDATRGGISSVLNEWAMSSCACIDIYEEKVKIDSEVYGVCEVLGLEPYSLANEGVCVIAVPQECASEVLGVLRQHELGRDSDIIGNVRQTFAQKVSTSNLASNTYYQKVVLHTKYGSKRFLEYPQGEILPRIC